MSGYTRSLRIRPARPPNDLSGIAARCPLLFRSRKSTAYDPEGRVVATWGATYPVAYAYDAFGRMAAMATTRDPAHESVNLLTLLPEGVHLSHTSHASYPSHLLDTTRWLYHEPTGLLTNKVYADGKGTAYSYTSDGKLSQRTWSRLSPVTGLPLQTLYSYDATHTLAGIAYSDGTPAVTFAYDRLGRQLSAITAGVSTNLFAYDALTLALANETVIAFGETNVLTRATDSLGRPAGLSLSNPDTPTPPYALTYSYDPFGRFHSVSSLVSSVLSVANYSYLPGSHLLASVSNNLGLVAARTYEPHRDLIAAVSNSWGGNLVSAFNYTNDALGRRTARADSGSAFASTQANAFGYNARSEVASAAMRNGTSSYEFDPIGNRTEATFPEEPQPLVYASNPLNQYTNIVAGGVASVPIHDADGNMLSGPAGPAGAALSMVWDGENRLVAVTNGNTLVVSDYDYRSRRTRKRVYAFADDAWSLAESRTFLYDGWNLIRETIANQQSSITNHFVWGLDLSGSRQGVGGIGGLLSLHSSPLPLGEGQGEGGVIAPYYPTFDGNGNISEYLATNGVVSAHYEYDAFGRTIAQSGDLAAAFAYRFSTKYLDSETGLYYYGYRYYSSDLGRWVNRDPIGEAGGVNLAAFVMNRVPNAVDYLGKVSKNSVKCCTREKIDEGLQTLLEAYGKIEKKFQKDGIPKDSGKNKYSCFTLNAEVLSLLPNVHCWGCILKHSFSNRKWYLIGRRFDHWVVQCNGFNQDGAVLKEIVFDYWDSDAKPGADPGDLFIPKYPKPDDEQNDKGVSPWPCGMPEGLPQWSSEGVI